MPGCLHKLEVMPRQIISESEKQTLTMVADSVSTGVTSSGAIVFALSFVLGASLSLMWGLINTH